MTMRHHLALAMAARSGLIADTDEINGVRLTTPRRDPLLDLAERQEEEARRKAAYEAGAAKIREERLARKRAAFEKRNPTSPVV